MVNNYRCRPEKWEYATVVSVRAKFYEDGSYSVSYNVQLDRVTIKKSKGYPNGGAPLFITVGQDSISQVKQF